MQVGALRVIALLLAPLLATEGARTVACGSAKPLPTSPSAPKENPEAPPAAMSSPAPHASAEENARPPSPPSPPSPPLPHARADGEEIDGALEGRVLPEMMVAAVRAQSKSFTACMMGRRGAATFAITVAADGSVLRVHPSESTIEEPQLRCLVTAWLRAVFPPPIGSARARAVIPLVFR